MDAELVFEFSVIFALLFPLCLFMLSLQWLGRPTLSLRTIWDIVKGRGERLRYGAAPPGVFLLERAAASYDRYLQPSSNELLDMRRSYGRLGRAHKRIGYDLGYPAKLNKLEATTEANEAVTRAIAACARDAFPRVLRNVPFVSDGDLARVRETLKHFVRDWSAEGLAEREVIFGPIMDVLRDVTPSKRADMKVLVPGSGLGRLAWEISRLGFDTTANELSFFMTLAFRFLASPRYTKRVNEHVIHPYGYWFSHQRDRESVFRGLSFPDALPRLDDKLHLLEGDFLALRPPGTGYDYIVTLFFIDTSIDIISTVQQIHALLRPGGRWINLGPLLWPGGAQARLELCLDEVLVLARTVGFHVEGDEGDLAVPVSHRRKTVSCEYTADQHAMMKWFYQAEFWVATKQI